MKGPCIASRQVNLGISQTGLAEALDYDPLLMLPFPVSFECQCG